MVINLNETQQSAEHHYKLLINMQNKLRRSEAYLLSSAYRKVSASNAVFCATICADSLIGKIAVSKTAVL